MMDKDTLGYSGWKGLEKLGELASGEYLAFGALIWHGQFTCLTLQLLADFETMLFELGAWGSVYDISTCDYHF